MSWKSWNGKILDKRTEKAVSDGVFQTIEAVQAQAKQEVPFDEGFLSNSIEVQKDPTNSLRSIIGAGGVGAARIPYAVKWHENPANFQKGRKHNYIRDPIKNVAPKRIKENIEQELKKVW